MTLSLFTFLWCLEKGKNNVEEKVEERKNLPRVALLAQVFASYLYERLSLFTTPVALHPHHLHFFHSYEGDKRVWEGGR